MNGCERGKWFEERGGIQGTFVRGVRGGEGEGEREDRCRGEEKGVGERGERRRGGGEEEEK